MAHCGSVLRSAALLMVCAAGAAQAASFGVFDPRSMAMGGTGVSSGTSANAAYYNPALLAAARRGDRFAFEMMVAARVVDPNNLRDDIDNMESSGENLDTALNRFNQSQSTTNASQLANALGSFQNVLRTVDNKTAEANVFASPLTIAVPGKNLGWAIHASARADVSAKLFFAQSDDALLTTYRNAAQAYATSGAPVDLAALIAVGDTDSDGTLDDPNYQSRVDVRGAVFREYGVSLAREFQTARSNFALGITPKYVKVYTFDYTVNPQSSEIDADKGRKDHSSSNLDIGFATDLGSGFRMGLVGKNVISRSYATILGNTIEVKPQTRAGLSYHSPWTTVAVDVDLTENKPVSFDKPSQFAGIGAEIDAWDFLQLRVGYRSDLSGNYKGTPSVGLGLSIFGLHLDVAVAGREKEDMMGAVQLGLKF